MRNHDKTRARRALKRRRARQAYEKRRNTERNAKITGRSERAAVRRALKSIGGAS